MLESSFVNVLFSKVQPSKIISQFASPTAHIALPVSAVLFINVLFVNFAVDELVAPDSNLTAPPYTAAQSLIVTLVAVIPLFVTIALFLLF